jgi:spectinomycin phosphotransferase
MRTRPDGIGERDLAAAAARRWGLDLVRLSYMPEGGGSYHWEAATAAGERYFLTADDLTDKPWLGADPDSAFAGVRAGFGAALGLRADVGLPFIVAPVPALGGEPAIRLTARYSLAVFPFTDGAPGRWGDDLTPADATTLVRQLAELHAATPRLRSPLARRGMALPARPVLEAALAELGRPWAGGPFAEPLRRELAANAGTITGWLTDFDDLAAQVTRRSSGDVITHGEPHPGNLIKSNGRFMLIDWDTVALAPPERDLWMLNGSQSSLACYRESSGRAIDEGGLSYYRLAWALTDLALFTGVLRAPHERNADTAKAFQGVTGTLHPESRPGTSPFGRLPP